MPRDPKGHVVEREFLTLPVWDTLDEATAEQVARTVELCLPEPWAFKRLAWHECGDQKRWVAFFDYQNSPFALIPGHEAILGYDPKQPPQLTPAMAADWAESQDENDSLPTFAKFLAKYTTKLRQVSIAPMLAEVNPQEGYGIEDGAKKRRQFLSDGFRLPSTDEWEYLCGAGSRTLWRWGNECPTAGYPCDYKGRSRFKPHRQPNAFGLVFPNDEYDTEGVAGSGKGQIVPRSGDGGVMTCGGDGFVLGWLMLATCINNRRFLQDNHYDVIRRAYPVSPESLA
jgi:hypothetical protein